MFGLWNRSRPDVLKHWYSLLENFQCATAEFYSGIENELKVQQVPGLSIERVEFAEGSLLSAKRLYLRMTRERLVFDVCAAPFGTCFFFSCRFAEIPVVLRIWEVLVLLIGVFFGFVLYIQLFGFVFGSILFLNALSHYKWRPSCKRRLLESQGEEFSLPVCQRDLGFWLGPAISTASSFLLSENLVATLSRGFSVLGAFRLHVIHKTPGAHVVSGGQFFCKSRPSKKFPHEIYREIFV